MSFPIEAFIAKCLAENRSEEFISETTTFIKEMEAKGFPVLFSLVHFSIELGLPSDQVVELLSSKSINYTYFKLKKKLSKETREIMAPKEKIKFIQRWINFNILQKVAYEPEVTAFVPESSTLKNAKFHEGATYILKIDLLKFFDCIDQKRIYGIFRSFGYQTNLCRYFSELCTSRHRLVHWEGFTDIEKEILSKIISPTSRVLPQGAPTSPLLANLVARRMDKRFMKLSEKLGFNYSRYADDLCFSSNNLKSLPGMNLIRRIVEGEGFFINEKKISLKKKGEKQYVTGLSVTNGVHISKCKRREIFKHLYFLRKIGPEAHLQHLKSIGQYRTNYRDWLLGHISYNYSIDSKVGKKMFDIFNLINWEMGYKVSAIKGS